MENVSEPVVGDLDLEALDGLLTEVIRENREKVAGWVTGESGCWGFLAGRAVTACRTEVGRSLADRERRLVWHRLWSWLEQIKEQLRADIR